MSTMTQIEIDDVPLAHVAGVARTLSRNNPEAEVHLTHTGIDQGEPLITDMWFRSGVQSGWTHHR